MSLDTCVCSSMIMCSTEYWYGDSVRVNKVVARSKAWVCGRLLAGIAGSNPVGGGCLSLVSVVCCQAEASATG